MGEHLSSAIVPRSRKSRARYRVAVIGSGSWATAIVKIISVNLEHYGSIIFIHSEFYSFSFSISML